MALRIGLDIDGTISDSFHKAVYEGANKGETFGEFWINYNESFSETARNNHSLDPTLYTKYPPDIEVINALSLISRSHELFYISSRPEELESLTRRWIHFNRLPEGDVYVGVSDKRSLAITLDLDWFLEDSPDHLLHLQGAVEVLPRLRPWNAQLVETNGWPYIDSVSELPEYFRKSGVRV